MFCGASMVSFLGVSLILTGQPGNRAVEPIGYLPDGRAKATYAPLILDCVAGISPACAAAQNTMYWRPPTSYTAGMPSIASGTCVSHSILPSSTSKRSEE